MIRPAGQVFTPDAITPDTTLTTGQAVGAVVIAGTSVFVGNLLRGIFWGGLAALIVNVVQRDKRRSTRR